MIRSRLVLLVSAAFLASVGVAEARCVGGPKIHAITFASDGAQDGSLTIRRSIDGQGDKELLDDTGYISAQILAAHIIQKDDFQPTVLSAERSQTIQLLRLRLNKFKEVLLGAGIEASSPVFAKIKRVETILNRDLIVKDGLRDAWVDLDKALEGNGINVTAKARDAGTSVWGAEKLLSEFQMPVLSSKKLFNGCPVDTVGDVQFGDAKQVSISKPSQDTGDGGRQNDLNSFMKEKQKKQKGIN